MHRYTHTHTYMLTYHPCRVTDGPMLLLWCLVLAVGSADMELTADC